MIRLLIADDHTLVRKGLVQLLLDEPNIDVIDEARDGKEVLRKLNENEYDVLLLDISLPGRSGIDVLKQVKIIDQKLPVLILSMYPEEQYAIRSLRAGASGYLTKESAPSELIEAIRKVSKGGKYITTSLAEKLAAAMDSASKKTLHESLSDREYQVMCMIATGNTLKEISEKLSLSVKTVSTYRTRILKKMNMNNNAQLIHYAIKLGLVI
jgi:DNA-binding NarL/FixJ family response regulator